jgi:DNA-binding CsgD family transcriptional regulator
MNQKQISYYIPIADNNGVSFAAEDLHALRNKFISDFGSHTIYPSLRGIWFNRAGELFDDPIMLVQVVAGDTPNLVARISDIATLILDRFRQDAIFVTLGDVDVLSFGNEPNHQTWNGSSTRNGGQKKTSKALTPRQHQVLALVAAGYTNREIAQALWITEATVENHVHAVFQALSVSNRTEAATFALSNGIIQPKDSGNPSRLKN